MGAGVIALQVGGSPDAWRALGFTVTGEGLCRVGDTVLRITDATPPGLTGWVLSGITGGAAVDGIPTQWAQAIDVPAATHANTASAVDHVVVMTGDIDRTFAALEQAGMTLRRERTGGTPERPLRQGFFRHAECIVEVVGPVERAPDAGPASLWGVTVVVEDIDAAAALLGDRLGSVKDAVQPHRRIATVRSHALAGPPLALISA